MAASTARTARATAAHDLRDTVRVGPLQVDRAPVTNRRYAAFVAATGHRPPLYWPKGECPPTMRDHPVTGVDFFDALAFALWSGGSLPTEEQWIAVAGLTEPAAYVWGDLFDSRRCNTAKSGIRGTTPVGAYPGGAAPSGCLDLCGNVWEMTCTAFPGDSDSIIVKGGSWADRPAHARLDTQFRTRVNKGSGTVGFRLVYGVDGLLPHFIDRDLVDQCVAFRKADAPHFDADGDDGEFEAIVESLQRTAGPHLAKLEAEARASFVGSDTGSPAPATPPFLRRLRNAFAEIGKSTAWKRVLPTLRVFAKPGGSGSIVTRFRAAAAEVRRPRRGAPLKQAMAAALLALFPDRGRALRERIRASASQLTQRGGMRARMRRAWNVYRGRRPAGRQLVKVRGTPPPAAKPSVANRLMRNPRRVFVLLCIFAGSVLGLLGTMMRERDHGRAIPADPLARVERRPAAAPEPPKPPAPAAETPTLPSVTKVLSEEDVKAVMNRLVGGRPQERDEAERFLVWHRSETAPVVRVALAAEQEPAMRAGLAYVMASIEEEEDTQDVPPTVVSSAPQRGLVLVCESLEAAEEIAMVRRTGRASRIEVTVVLSGGDDAARVAKSYAHELGDVRLYVDKERALAKKLRLERTPAVVGFRADGKVLGISYGRVRRSNIADLAAKLR